MIYYKIYDCYEFRPDLKGPEYSVRPRRDGRHWSAPGGPQEKFQHWLGIEPGTPQS